MKRKLTFSEHLQDLIKKNAWSLREVQARTGISHSTIGQIANGEMEGIKLETIKAIVKGLKIAPRCIAGLLWAATTYGRVDVVIFRRVSTLRENAPTGRLIQPQ